MKKKQRTVMQVRKEEVVPKPELEKKETRVLWRRLSLFDLTPGSPGGPIFTTEDSRERR